MEIGKGVIQNRDGQICWIQSALFTKMAGKQ